MLKHFKFFPLQIIITNRLPGHCSSWPVAAFECVGLLSHIAGQGMRTVLGCASECGFGRTCVRFDVYVWFNVGASAGLLKELTENDLRSVPDTFVIINQTLLAPKRNKELPGCPLSRQTAKWP